jgi:hypothetical protein
MIITTYLVLDMAKFVSLADNTYNLVSSPNCGFWLINPHVRSIQSSFFM